MNTRQKRLGLIIISLIAMIVTASTVHPVVLNETDSTNTSLVEGLVTVDGEPVQNASVQLYNRHGLVTETQTKANGSFSMQEPDSNEALLSVSINGEYKIDGNPYHAGDFKSIESDAKFRFSTDSTVEKNINGTQHVINYHGVDESDRRTVSDVYMLQGIDTDEEYEVTRNINGSSTRLWNKKTTPVTVSIPETINGEELAGRALDLTVFYALGEEVSNPQNLDYTRARENGIYFDLGEKNYNYPVEVEFETKNTVYNGFKPIGSEDNPFTGEVDGNGFEVTNLHIKRDADVGLFGFTKNAEVHHIGLADSQFEGGELTSSVVAVNQNSTIRDTYSRIDVNMNKTIGRAGGLTGRNTGVVKNSYVQFNSTHSDGTAGAVTYENNGSISSTYYSAPSKYSSTASKNIEGTVIRTGNLQSELRLLDFTNTWHTENRFVELQVDVNPDR